MEACHSFVWSPALGMETDGSAAFKRLSWPCHDSAKARAKALLVGAEACGWGRDCRGCSRPLAGGSLRHLSRHSPSGPIRQTPGSRRNLRGWRPLPCSAVGLHRRVAW